MYMHTALPHLIFFFFNDTAITEIYTLSLHDALPICLGAADDPALPTVRRGHGDPAADLEVRRGHSIGRDRKSTRLNSSHSQISYAVFCLKKKKSKQKQVSECPQKRNGRPGVRSCSTS